MQLSGGSVLACCEALGSISSSRKGKKKKKKKWKQRRKPCIGKDNTVRACRAVCRLEGDRAHVLGFRAPFILTVVYLASTWLLQLWFTPVIQSWSKVPWPCLFTLGYKGEMTSLLLFSSCFFRDPFCSTRLARFPREDGSAPTTLWILPSAMQW